jgi:hypothetical protein
MVITMSVMPRSLTLARHRTVMGSLQSFKIYKYFRAPQMMMQCVSNLPCHPPSRPLARPLHHLCVFIMRMSFIATPSPPRSLRCGNGLQSGPPLPPKHRVADLILQKGKGGEQPLFRGKGSSGCALDGGFQFWNLRGPQPASPIVAPRKRGSIMMSRSCGPCEEIPKSVTLACWG